MLKNIEMMIFNQIIEVNFKANSGDNIKIVDDFKYLGSYVNSSINDIKIQKNFVKHRVWTSSLPRKINIKLFTIFTIWLQHMDKECRKSLDGTYTRC